MGKSKPEAAVTTDPRFARIHSDPRFQRLPKKQAKVKVDKRFERLFTDKEFKVVKQSAPVDRKGRKTKVDNDDLLQRQYELDDDDADVVPAKTQKRRRPEVERDYGAEEEEDDAGEEEEDDDDEGEGEGEEDEDEEEHAMDAEEGEGSTTEDDSDEEGEEGEEGEEEAEDDEGEEGDEEGSALLAFMEQQASVPRVKDATARLAIVNCDWEQVRAVDLLAVLRSFVPSTGSIKSVAVYLSDFGAEQQAKEATHGPSGIWAAPQDDGAGGSKAGLIDGGRVDNEKLRKYELERFRHYYAVVTCDSAHTADALYAECDGAELEASSMVLDLRFIPDDMAFSRTPRDEARVVPPKYATPAWAASALQQSTVTSSWDADDSERKRAMQKNFKKSEMREMEYAAYLASDSGSDDDGVEEYPFLDAPLAPPRDARDARRAVLQAVGGAAGAADDEEGEVAHELTYLPGLEGKTTAKARRRERGEAEPEAPSVFELEQQKRALKAKARKQERLAARNGDGAEDDDELPDGVADDPFFAEALAERAQEEAAATGGARASPPKRRGGGGEAGSSAEDAAGGAAARKGKKGKKGKRALSAEEAAAEARRAAELELLLMDGDDDERGYDAKRLELPAAGRNLKGKKRAKEAAAAAAAAEDDGFRLDAADARFSRLYSSHEYAIDPTHPKFKRTVASEQLMAEISRQHDAAPPEPEPVPPGASADPGLAKLVTSLKAKAKAKAKPDSQRPAKRPLSQ